MVKIARSTHASQWTRERIDTLSTPEVKQLRDNAQRLNESEIATLCDEILGKRPRGRGGVKKKVLKAG